MIPVDQAAAKHDGVSLHTAFEPFVSPLDGTVINGRAEYRDHCKKHGVVPAAEFTQEFYDRKAAERASTFQGGHSRQETLARKREIYENMMRAERNAR